MGNLKELFVYNPNKIPIFCLRVKLDEALWYLSIVDSFSQLPKRWMDKLFIISILFCIPLIPLLLILNLLGVDLESLLGFRSIFLEMPGTLVLPVSLFVAIVMLLQLFTIFIQGVVLRGVSYGEKILQTLLYDVYVSESPPEHVLNTSEDVIAVQNWNGLRHSDLPRNPVAIKKIANWIKHVK